jgi:hypothetical protein
MTKELKSGEFRDRFIQCVNPTNSVQRKANLSLQGLKIKENEKQVVG